MSEEKPAQEDGATSDKGSVVDLLIEFLGHMASQSKVGIGKAQERGRQQLEVRQLRKDRSKRLEKLGREVMALVAAGEVVHPGLSDHMAHIQDLDLKIQTGLALGASEAGQSSASAEE